MTLSDEWLDFLAYLSKHGSVSMGEYPKHFVRPDLAQRLLGEIIRQGLVDPDNSFTVLNSTPTGRDRVKDRVTS